MKKILLIITLSLLTSSNLFAENFNQPIGDWNVSNVINMECMFKDARIFNQPIGNWDVSSGTNFSYMFLNSDFNFLQS